MEPKKHSDVGNRGSTAVKILEEVWNNKLRQKISGLPEVVIVLLAAGNRKRKLGHFAYSVWKYRKNENLHEVAVSPDLFEDKERLLECLLHESVHALLFAVDSNNPRHLAGCSRASKYYHTKEFRDICLNLGLYCAFHNTRYGFCLTGFVNGTPHQYEEVIEFLKNSLPYGTGIQLLAPELNGQELPPSGHIKLTCNCERSIYSSMSVAKKMGISCDFCKSEFKHRTETKTV